ncbi:MAG: DUF2304 domain-containing protein [Clostridia bacterium]|nr:DUF2304 domain-containing protein [Clostridia bacterium]MDD4386830.1 DUF2304 domain-containing protein [Clostridia bacterium]
MEVNLFFAIVGIVLAIYILSNVKNNKFDIGESLLWLFGTLAIVIVGIFPNIVKYISNLVGIEYAPSLFFLVCIIFILLINFRNSKKLLKHQEKIITLSQEIAILKEKIREER